MTNGAEAMTEDSPSQLIDAKIADLGGWRGKALSRMRGLIREADPQVVEEVKWRKPGNPSGVPVWEHAGILCTGETYKDKVKLTFANGASLEDPNASGGRPTQNQPAKKCARSHSRTAGST